MNYPLKDALLTYVLTGNCDEFYYVYEMIEKYGISPVPRRSFLKKILGDSNG